MPEPAPPRPAPAGITCPDCGGHTPHRRYCTECGAALPARDAAWGRAETGAQEAVAGEVDESGWGQAATGTHAAVAHEGAAGGADDEAPTGFARAGGSDDSLWARPTTASGDGGGTSAAGTTDDVEAWEQAATGSQGMISGDDDEARTGVARVSDSGEAAWGQAATGSQPIAEGPGDDAATGMAAAVGRGSDDSDGPGAAGSGSESVGSGAQPRVYTPMRFSDDVQEKEPRVRTPRVKVPREQGASRTRLAVAAAIAVVVVMLGAVVWPVLRAQQGPDDTAPVVAPTSKAPSANQVMATALALDRLLAQSGSDHALAGGAASCSVSAERAYRDLQSAYDGRRRVVDQLGKIDFTTLPRGEELKANLTTAWTTSLLADSQFRDWAEARMGTSAPCSVQMEDYQQGLINSRTAVRHKQKFITIWENNVRAPLNLRTRRTADEI